MKWKTVDDWSMTYQFFRKRICKRMYVEYYYYRVFRSLQVGAKLEWRAKVEMVHKRFSKSDVEWISLIRLFTSNIEEVSEETIKTYLEEMHSVLTPIIRCVYPDGNVDPDHYFTYVYPMLPFASLKDRGSKQEW